MATNPWLGRGSDLRSLYWVVAVFGRVVSEESMKSPGQAAREAYEAQNPPCRWKLTDWDSIAQAAIDAFRAEARAPLEAKIQELRYALHETEAILVVEGLICDEERFDYE